jgi:hypothetical protein
MFYSHIVAIAIKIIPYSLVLGFLLPRYSDMSTASALTTALILAVITTTMDLVPLPEFIIPNVDHKTGLLISASLDVAITYAVIWFARLITMAASFSVIGFLLISPIHLENMLKLARCGVVIMPPAPALYHRPATVEEVVNQTAGRALELLGIRNKLYPRWK